MCKIYSDLYYEAVIDNYCTDKANTVRAILKRFNLNMGNIETYDSLYAVDILVPDDAWLPEDDELFYDTGDYSTVKNNEITEVILTLVRAREHDFSKFCKKTALLFEIQKINNI